ncbi:xylose isomerase-like protein [Schizothecium vesticola]|uniref:Apurinic-apyrimidinic endonuclease 1 n=1 Tax=Schizothecium vesticola TaxID=314040 RepID=A0AA40K503_9PEZI|nr:xylose isomerase-like protein [Schizothecium vesticola]
MVRKPPRKAIKTEATDVVDKVKTAVATAKATVKKAVASKRKAARDPDSDAENDPTCDSCHEKEESDDDAVKKPAPKKRKTTAAPSKKGDTMAPLAARTPVTLLKRAMYIGAHVSAAGGVQNALTNASSIGGNAFALFLKSQRKWTSPPLTDESKSAFLSLAKTTPYSPAHILPHGSYLVNLAQPDPAKAAQAFSCFVDDLERCAALGITLYNFHPGSTGGAAMPSACARIAAQLNRAHAATPGTNVVTVLENMCGSGNVVGSRFEELRAIIDGVEDQTRVGVCLDTCHAFAAGYDLRTPASFAAAMAEFDRVVGLRYLRALHLNDSKAPLGSHRDLHANIGTGFLGLRAFHNIMNFEGFEGLPMVLETPIDEKGPGGKAVENKQVWADEIKLLESLIGMDADAKEFAALEAELQAKGEGERNKIQEQVDKKAEKDAKKGARGAAKKKPAKRKKEEADDEDESD